jgi:hypothetical protein
MQYVLVPNRAVCRYPPRRVVSAPTDPNRVSVVDTVRASWRAPLRGIANDAPAVIDSQRQVAGTFQPWLG